LYSKQRPLQLGIPAFRWARTEGKH
jgi:hypothetical protein